MRVPPNPLGRVVEAAAHGPESLLRLAALVPRVATLLDSAEQLLTRVEAVVSRLSDTEAALRSVVERVAADERAARAVVDAVAGVQQRAGDLLNAYEPLLQESVGTASYLSSRVGPAQVDAAVAYLDFLPMLQTIDRDVVPTMSTLQTIAPDLTELLAVSRALNELMGSLPGLGRAKKRVDEELARERDDPERV